MTRAARPLFAAALGLLTAALAAAPAARAQPVPVRPQGLKFQPPQIVQPPQVQFGAGGTEVFRALFSKAGVRPVKRNEMRNVILDSDLIVVVLGAGLREFGDPHAYARGAVRSNGAVLVASDDGLELFSGFEPRPRLGWFGGGTVTAAARDCYRGQTDCPFVVPVSPEELNPPVRNPGRVWDVFRGLPRVATNSGTALLTFRFTNEFAVPVARYPRSALYNGEKLNPPPLFAAGGEGPRAGANDGYAYLAVADPSVYVNQALLAPDTDNLTLATRTIEFLRGPQGRSRCAFFENGQLVEDFDSLREALAPPRQPVPPGAVPNLGPLIGKNQDKLVAKLDEMVDRLQEKDVVQRALVGEPGSPRERERFAGFVTYLAVVVAVRVTFMLLGRTVAARQPADVPPPPATGAGAAPTGPTGVFDRRQRELVRRNNVFEPVSHRMREFFVSVGAPPDAGPRIPRVETTGAVRKPESLRQAIRDMWRIAFGPPVPLSAQRWFEMEPYFERLRQAHAAGKWWFARDGE